MPYASFPRTPTASPVVNVSHQSGTFVTIDEPTFTHPNNPESKFPLPLIVCIVHSVGLGFRFFFKPPN